VLLVQCDFDDTITVGNVSVLIREAFADDDWRQMEEEYFAGSYSVEESNIRQFALVRATKVEIEELLAARVVVREGFEGFVRSCQSDGIKLVVVSSGLDIYINPVMGRLGLAHLDMHSGTADYTGSGIHVEYNDPWGRPLTRGFKDSFLRYFKERGHTVVYIGDGLSDIAPAAEADFVIARSKLKRHFDDNAMPVREFATFEDVGRHLEEIRGLVGG
jgi:2-hydroxy-3-keto-5-methylthiopentenyl-1-phosphate phosphatase